ncbi:MAG: hypothetical protein RIS47_1258 [Bacteroidota bacterium]|jgi:hypothetical protein
MKKFLIVILLLSSLAVGAQDTIFVTKDNRQTIALRTVPGQEITSLSQILDFLAKQNTRSRKGISFSYEVQNTILRDEKNLYISAQLLNPVFNGNVIYRGFDVSSVLIPSKVSGIVDFKYNSQPIKQFIFSKNAIDPELLLLFEIEQTDSLDKGKYEISTKALTFHYDEANQANFDTYTYDVDGYYADYDTLTTKITELQRMDFSPEHLTQDSVFLPKANLLLSQNQDYLNGLADRNYDYLVVAKDQNVLPIADKIAQLQLINNKFSSLVENQIQQTYGGLILNIESLLQRSDLETAQTLITNELFPLGLFAAGHYYLSEIFFRQQSIELSRKRLLIVAKKYNPSADIKLKSEGLAIRIEKALLDSAQLNTQTNNYDQSIAFVQKAIELSEAFPRPMKNIAQQGTLPILVEKTHLQYFEYAKTLYQNNQEKKALEWFSNSLRIASAFNLPIDTLKLNQQILQTKLDYQQKIASTIDVQVNNYELAQAEASISLEQQFRTDNQLQNSKAVSLAIQNWAEKKRIFLLKEISNNYNNKEYTATIDNIFEIKNLASKYKFDLENEIDSFLIVSAQQETDSLVASVKRNDAGLFDIDDQISRLEDIEKSTTANHQQTLQNLAQKLKELSLEVCKNIGTDFNNLLNTALTEVSTNAYFEADGHLQQAIAAAQSGNCGIETTSADELRQTIKPCVSFYITLQSIQQSILEGNYDGALEQYEQLDEFFQSNALQTRGLTLDPMLDFIVKSDNLDFINSAIAPYLAQSNYDTAFYLLNHLYHKKTDSKVTRNAQITLGTAISNRDYKENSGRSVKEVLGQYTNGDKWFSVFNDAFLTKWDQLKSSEPAK